MSIPRSRVAGRAFTLVEMLVAIGIVVVIISLLLPALSKARQSMYALKCQSGMKQIGMAMFLYASDYKGAIPPAGIKYSLPAASTGLSYMTFDMLLKPYLSNNPVPPTNVWGTGTDTYNKDPDVNPSPLWQCPEDQLPVNANWGQPFQKRSYAMIASQPVYPVGSSYARTMGTGMVTDVSSTGNAFPGLNPSFKFLKFTNVPSSSEVLLLAENFSETNVLGCIVYDATYGPSRCAINCPQDQLGSYTTPAHNNRWNYLMCDGSVQSLNPADTLQGTPATPSVWYNNPYPAGYNGRYSYYGANSPNWVNYMWVIH